MKARVPVNNSRIKTVISELSGAINRRIEKHGRDSFIGPHEIYGVLAEEVDEYKAELRNDADVERHIAELFDIAVAALFGIASLRANRVWTFGGSKTNG